MSDHAAENVAKNSPPMYTASVALPRQAMASASAENPNPQLAMNSVDANNQWSIACALDQRSTRYTAASEALVSPHSKTKPLSAT